MKNELDYLNEQEEQKMEELVKIKTRKAELMGQQPAPKKEEPQDATGKNLIIMIEVSKEQTIKIPDNFEQLPMTLQRTIVREQQRNMEAFCHALKNFIETDGAYALKTDKERKPVFTCRGAILEYKTPNPDLQMITAGLELVVRHYKWQKGKVLGSRAFIDMVMKIAKASNTRLEITNPPAKDEDTTAGEDTGRLDSNKMSSSFKKGFKN